MPVTTDIVATYRGPGKVVRRLLAAGPREDRALVIVMASCVVMFVARWPAIAREAHLTGKELNMELGGALMGGVFILPLVLYFLAFLSHGVFRLFKGQGTQYGARLALFWALLAASPLALLNGLVAGFIGPGPALTAVGVLWAAVFLWFWLRGLYVAETEPVA
ncbi:YIP1 family protein [Mesobacterium sp. TK19101]|uniref:YIP1 family protein n=1 Tax=Mesobacterium hydrothermale TaxID=3111907 RepID=A0ABU6HM94_9RHOB|nr:YIP1 family protein [Mesobacterium sp. TK19101]MEC3862975.1 YIP1 family protein [Mesobacterium sp. TK19101]